MVLIAHKKKILSLNVLIFLLMPNLKYIYYIGVSIGRNIKVRRRSRIAWKSNLHKPNLTYAL